MRIVKHIPNTITSMNLLCGVLGVMSALKGNLDTAFYLMLIGALCDFCDGLAARALNAYSDLGKELDSLADLITFGLLPAIMLYKCMDIYHPGEWYCYIPLVIVIFSAIRLAKFNTDDRQTHNFLGLATPACAMICGSFTYVAHLDIYNIAGAVTASSWIIPVASVLLSILLVSEIPMFSIKFSKGASSDIKWMRITFVAVAVIAVVATLIMGQHFSHAVLFIFLAYILINIIHAIVQR